MKRARIIWESDAPDTEWGSNRDSSSKLVVVETDDSQPPKYPQQPHCGLRPGETIVEEVGDDNACPEDACLSRDFVWTAHLLDRCLAAEAEVERLRAALAWYGTTANWEDKLPNIGRYKCASVDLDCGERARKALEASNGN